MKKILNAFLLASIFLAAGALSAEASYEEGVEARKTGDYAEALHQWLVASDDPRCMTAIGVMYDYGEGLPRDEKKAAEWYTKAAAEGEYRAIAQLANFSLTGAGGVEQNPAEWRRRLEEIEGKDGYADYILACFYMDGYGGGENLAKAGAMLRALVEKGYTQLEPISRQVERRLSDQKAGVREIGELTFEMAANSASFDQEFKDKRLTVSGWVNTLERLHDRGYLLKFGGPQLSNAPQDNVLAVFYEPSDTAEVAALKPGYFVKLEGTYIGRHPFPLGESAFTLFGCSLIDAASEDVRQ